MAMSLALSSVRLDGFRQGSPATIPASFSATLLSSLVPEVYTGSSTPTMTRATTAYVTDFEGLLKQVPSGCARFTGARFVRNLVQTKSEDMTNVAWTAANATKTAATATATAINGIVYNQIPSADWLPGVYVIRVKLARLVGTGDIELSVDNAVFTTVPITATPTTYAVTITAATVANFCLLRFKVSGDSVSATEWQMERVTGQSNQNPSEYVSVGVLSAPYHGAGVDGCKYFTTQNGNTVASNVVTEATGAAISSATLLGYQAEGARTNRCLQSQVFSNAAWVSGGGGIAVTNNSIAAPDGTTTADTLTASGANGTLIQDLGTVASAAKAGGLWIKRKTGTGNVDLTLDGGATWTNITVTAGWTRVQKTQTLADEDFGIRIVTSGDEVYAWQGQVETASFLSSDIPTTTVAVTRNADVLTYSSASNISWTVGSIVLDAYVSVFNSSTNPRIFESGGGDPIVYTSGATTCQSYDGTNAASVSAGGSVVGAVRKYGVTWGTGLRCFREGSAGTGTAFDGTFAVGATMLPLPYGAWFGNVRNMAIYTNEKTAAEMQALTT